MYGQVIGCVCGLVRLRAQYVLAQEAAELILSEDNF